MNLDGSPYVKPVNLKFLKAQSGQRAGVAVLEIRFRGKWAMTAPLDIKFVLTQAACA